MRPLTLLALGLTASLLAACGRAPDLAGSGTTGTLAPQATSGITSFRHPGIALSRANLDRIRLAVQNRTEPTSSGWVRLTSSPFASPAHVARPKSQITTRKGGPYADPSGPYGSGDLEMREDSFAAFANALEWYVTGQEQHAKAAIRIMNAYSEVSPTIDGSNAELLAAHTAVQWANAAEIIKHTYKPTSSPGWTSAAQQSFARMLRDKFYGVIQNFLPDTYAGNWDAAVINAMMAMGVFLDDIPMFNRGWDRYMGTQGSGALQNYIAPVTYEVAETCRDQEHAQMGLGYLAGAAEIAYNQGSDALYSAHEYRLLRGYEFEANYILSRGQSATLRRCPASKTQPLPDDIAKVRGDDIQRYPVWEIMHNHYHDRRQFNTTYSRQIVLDVRARLGGEGYNHTLLGFGTALYARPTTP